MDPAREADLLARINSDQATEAAYLEYAVYVLGMSEQQARHIWRTMETLTEIRSQPGGDQVMI